MDKVENAKQEVLTALRERGCTLAREPQLVGSTFYAGSGNDIDILVLLKESAFEASFHNLSFEGWVYGGSTSLAGDKWMSWKKGSVNMLLTNDVSYFVDWLTAAEVCKYLTLKGYALKKCDVHGIHEIIMDESDAEREVSRRNY